MCTGYVRNCLGFMLFASELNDAWKMDRLTFQRILLLIEAKTHQRRLKVGQGFHVKSPERAGKWNPLPTDRPTLWDSGPYYFVLNCKSSSFFNYSFFGLRPQRQWCPVKYRENLCVHLFGHLFVHPLPLSQPLQGSGLVDKWTDRQTNR